MYFVFVHVDSETGNPVYLERNLLGCFENYLNAFEIYLQYITKEEEYNTEKDSLELDNEGDCDCCKELHSYIIDNHSSSIKVSLYECQPH